MDTNKELFYHKTLAVEYAQNESDKTGVNFVVIKLDENNYFYYNYVVFQEFSGEYTSMNKPEIIYIAKPINLFANKLESKTIKQINKYFRAMDESHLYPINNRFNVTEKAIKRIQRNKDLILDCGYSYKHYLCNEISKIVNGEF